MKMILLSTNETHELFKAFVLHKNLSHYSKYSDKHILTLTHTGFLTSLYT